MGLKVKDRAKPKLPPVEPGVYMAVCVKSLPDADCDTGGLCGRDRPGGTVQ